MSASCCHAKPPEDAKPSEPDFSAKVRLYRPLIVVASVALVLALALYVGAGMMLMTGWMGGFLILLATLKLFDVQGFVGAFRQYDPLAMRVKAYACLYPFLELALGGLILAGVWPLLVNLVLMAVFAVNAAGVGRVLQTGAAVRCGCAGAGFNLPVGRVTLLEDLLMVVMGLWGLIIHL